MTATSQDFEEILHAEHQVDIDKLRQLAIHGVPQEIRPLAWFQLLSLSRAEIPASNIDGEYKSLRNEIERYCKQREFTKPMQSCMESVIRKFTSNNYRTNFTRSLISLTGPLVVVFQHEELVYWALDSLYSRIQCLPDIENLISNFLMLFRLLIPSLFTHFQEEEVETREWVVLWFQTLLSKQLPMECVLRLWDAYFSDHDGLLFHCYVCLAILSHFSEDLLGILLFNHRL
jgi:hypothetical protein